MHALVLFHEVRKGRLHLQRIERSVHCPIIHVGEEERGFDLALFHVSDKGGGVAGAGEADTVFPHGVDEFRRFSGHAAQIGVEVAVEVCFEDEIAGFQMIFASGESDVDDVIEDDEAREIGAGNSSEWAAIIPGQLTEIPAKLHRMTNIKLVVLNDGGQDGQSVGLAADVGHVYVPTGAMPVEPRSGATVTWNASQAFSKSDGERDWLFSANFVSAS